MDYYCLHEEMIHPFEDGWCFSVEVNIDSIDTISVYIGDDNDQVIVEAGMMNIPATDFFHFVRTYLILHQHRNHRTSNNRFNRVIQFKTMKIEINSEKLIINGRLMSQGKELHSFRKFLRSAEANWYLINNTPGGLPECNV